MIFQFDSKDIYYNIVGKGRPMLLLHGNTASSYMFRSEIEYFSHSFKVIYFDYLGHGQSRHIDSLPENFWKLNADIARALLDYLNIDDTIVIGSSGGSLVALNLAINYQGAVSRLVLDSPLRERLNGEEGRHIINMTQKALKNYLYTKFWEKCHGSNWDKIISQYIALIQYISLNGVRLIYGSLSNLTIPVLITGSAKDNLIDIPKNAAWLQQGISGAEQVIFDWGAHPAMVTRKQAFRKAVSYFIHD